MSKARQTRVQSTGAPLALAMLQGALSALGVSLIYFLIEISIPTSALRTFFDLVHYNYTVTLPGTALYQQLSSDVNRQMALFSDPISYLIGGIVFARTVARRYTQRQVFIAGGGMALGLNIAVLAMLWGIRLAGQHGHLAPNQIDPKLELMQTLLSLFWVGLSVVGMEIGLRWRRAADARSEKTPTPASVAR